MYKNDSRRKLLKAIAAGSGALVAGQSLPKSWTKPVINSVTLPAHATKTDDTGSGGPAIEVTTTPDPCEAGTYDIASCSIEQLSGKATLSTACHGITVSLSLYATNLAYKPIYADTDLNGVAQFDFDLLDKFVWTGRFEAPNGSKCLDVWNAGE